MASLPGDSLLCEPGEKLIGIVAPAAEGIERKGDKGGPRFLRGRAVFTAFGRFGVAERARGSVDIGQTTVTSIQTGGAPSI